MSGQCSNIEEFSASSAARRGFTVPKLVVLGAVGLAILLVVVDTLLILQNRRMKLLLSQPAPAFLPLVGSNVPSLSGIDESGTRESLPYGNDPRSTIVFVFAKNCEICGLNWPIWTDRAARIDRQRFRLVYLNLGSPVNQDYLQSHQIQNSIVLVEPDPQTIIKYNLRFTPETILVDNRGIVTNVWAGLLEGALLSDVDRALGLTLSVSWR